MSPTHASTVPIIVPLFNDSQGLVVGSRGVCAPVANQDLEFVLSFLIDFIAHILALTER